MGPKVVLLWLDAFSSRYVLPNISPTLSKLREAGYLNFLENMFAYQGLWYSFLTSTEMSKHGVWTEHVRNKEGLRLPASLAAILRLSEYVPDDYLSKALRFAGYAVLGQDYGTPHLIPASLVRYFEIKKPSPKLKTFFQILDDHGLKYDTLQPRVAKMEGTVLSKIERMIHVYDVAFLKLGSLDRIGHKLGPSGRDAVQRAQYLDGLVGSLIHRIEDSGEKVLLVIMSDHGMTPTLKTVDIQQGLQKLPLRVLRDYLFFVGATYVSFWFENTRAKTLVSSFLREQPNVKILNREDRIRLGLGALADEFGELIAVNPEGQIFFPDFYWKRQPARGMHGFAFSSYDYPILGFYSNLVDARFEDRSTHPSFIDIAPTVLRFLDIPRPSYFQGKSLLST